MLLKVFKANRVYNFILVPLLAFAYLVTPFFQEKSATWDNAMPLFQLVSLIANNSVWQNLLLLLFSLIICFILLRITTRHSFINNRSFLPPVIYMALAISIPELQEFRPIVLAAFFILLAVQRLFDTYQKSSALTNSFDAAFFVGLASLSYLHSGFLFLIVPIGLYIIQRNLSFRKILISIIGVILPWIFTFSYYRFTDRMDELFDIVQYQFHHTSALTTLNLPLTIFLGLIAFIIIISSIFILNQYDLKKIHSRRYLTVLFVLFAGSGLLLFFPAVSFEIIIIMALPLTYLFTNYFIYSKRIFWAGLFFDLLLISSLALQFIYPYVS